MSTYALSFNGYFEHARCFLVTITSASRRVLRNGLSQIATMLAISAIVAGLSFSHPIAAQNVQRNNEAVDLGLRSSLTVNPATRAVELQIPLGNYPGRAGHDVPVTIS